MVSLLELQFSPTLDERLPQYKGNILEMTHKTQIKKKKQQKKTEHDLIIKFIIVIIDKHCYY